MNSRKAKTVAVAMSGGVDSSLTAALLVEEGYKVIGLFMKNWSTPIKGVENCPWVEDALDARRVAHQLAIPFYSVNFEAAYQKYVLEPFFADYRAGRTPNPDILCNKWIKFEAFWRFARHLGAEAMATGHYARIKDGCLAKGLDRQKDQTYFLWSIAPAVLPHVLFPLGEMTKEEVRREARRRGLVTAEKKDSQGICFIGQANLRDFLTTRLPLRPGSVLNCQGQVIGEHMGAWFYTIGQRAGLSDARWENQAHRPVLYVLEIDTAQNTLTVGGEAALYDQGLEATSLNWFGPAPRPGEKYGAKIRSGQPDQACAILSLTPKRIKVVFTSPQRAITPGQSLVLYQGDRLIGGGIISLVLGKEVCGQTKNLSQPARR